MDLLSELNRLNGRVDDLLNRLDTAAWQIVAERATDLRVSIAAIIIPENALIPDDVRDNLAVAVTQFKNISDGANRATTPHKTAPDINRYKKIAVDQKETIVLAIEHVKRRLGSGE